MDLKINWLLSWQHSTLLKAAGLRPGEPRLFYETMRALFEKTVISPGHSLGAFIVDEFRENIQMHYLELTLPTIAENLALDEALLDEADAGLYTDETLRLWESPDYAVIVGRSSRLDLEVNRHACRRMGVPVLRRVSGGAAVVIGPGCLLYAVVLNTSKRLELRSISHVHRFVLGRLAVAIQAQLPMVSAQGICDLTLLGQKVSGNSVRMKRNCVLYHGTLLYNFPLKMIGTLLTMPPRTPDYRGGREHGKFVANLPIGRDELRQSLRTIWQAEVERTTWPTAETARHVTERYSQSKWNEQF